MSDTAEPREALARAIAGERHWSQSTVNGIFRSGWTDDADAVADHLWSRALEPETVAEFAKRFHCKDCGGDVGPATPIHYLLTALVGPQPTEGGE